MKQLIKSSWHSSCVPLPFTRWSSSRSTSRATRWCTGLHRRGCRGASGRCSRCAPQGRTAPSCHSSGKESHTNSKSAPSSMNSRGRTVTSKLAKRWRKVGVDVTACVTVCEVCFRACICARMFSCLHNFYVHSLHVWERTTAVHSRQRGQDYVMFKCGALKHARVHAQLFKGPYGNPYTPPQCKCYTNFSWGVVVAVSWGLVETQLQISICSKQLREMWAHKSI